MVLSTSAGISIHHTKNSTGCGPVLTYSVGKNRNSLSRAFAREDLLVDQGEYAAVSVGGGTGMLDVPHGQEGRTHRENDDSHEKQPGKNIQIPSGPSNWCIELAHVKLLLNCLRDPITRPEASP